MYVLMLAKTRGEFGITMKMRTRITQKDRKYRGDGTTVSIYSALLS